MHSSDTRAAPYLSTMCGSEKKCFWFLRLGKVFGWKLQPDSSEICETPNSNQHNYMICHLWTVKLAINFHGFGNCSYWNANCRIDFAAFQFWVNCWCPFCGWIICAAMKLLASHYTFVIWPSIKTNSRDLGTTFVVGKKGRYYV